MITDMETRRLGAGTMVHINGIPCFLKEEADIETASGNWGFISTLGEADSPNRPPTNPPPPDAAG